MRGRKFGGLVASLGLAVITVACSAPVSGGYPTSYRDTVDAGRKEGQLEIWSVTDTRQVDALLADFHRRYPEITVSYKELPSTEIYNRFLTVNATHRGIPDFLWSSAMDLQIKLVNDGYAQSYATPESAAIPDWAVWKDQAWGVTAEPIVFAYNRRLIAPDKVPKTHFGLERLINVGSEKLKGKIATYDPSASAVGFLYFMQDVEANRDSWALFGALGRSHAELYDTTAAMLDQLTQGKKAFAYNMVGSYVFEAQAGNSDIGVVMPQDYTLVMSRIAMIPANAPHPSAAKLFLDYLLSRDGQGQLARRYMTPVRSDVEIPAALQTKGIPTRAIDVGPALLINQDRLTRASFLKKWSRAFTE